jgi:hypothetical protein
MTRKAAKTTPMIGVSATNTGEAAGPAKEATFALFRIVICILVLRRSVRGETAVDRQANADDEARARTAEPQHSGGNFLCATEAAD